MAYIHAVRDWNTVPDIFSVSCICNPNNPDDCFAKIGKFHASHHLLLTVKCDFSLHQWVIRWQNKATPTNYLSTAYNSYLCSYIHNFIHPSCYIISSYMRISKNASLKTVPEEITENISVQLLECVHTVSILWSNSIALSFRTFNLLTHQLMLLYSQRSLALAEKMTAQLRTHAGVLRVHFYC